MSFHNIIPYLCTANYVLPSLVWFLPLPCSAFLYQALPHPAMACLLLSHPLLSFPSLTCTPLPIPVLICTTILYSSNYNQITPCSVLCRHPVQYGPHVYPTTVLVFPRYLHTPYWLIYTLVPCVALCSPMFVLSHSFRHHNRSHKTLNTVVLWDKVT